MRAIVGGKVQGAVEVGQAGGVRAGAAGVDVRDQHGAGRRAVALPQLLPIRVVVGREVENAIDIRQVGRVGAVGDVGGVLSVVAVRAQLPKVFDMGPREDVL